MRFEGNPTYSAMRLSLLTGVIPQPHPKLQVSDWL